MSQQRIASRYAQSLLDLARERGELELVFTDATELRNTLANSRELRVAMGSPVVPNDKKLQILKALFPKMNSVVWNEFLNLIVRKGRASNLQAIAESLIAQYKTHKNILSAEVTTAVPLTGALRSEVKQTLARMTSGEVEILEKVDPQLIGGYIIRLNDRQIDASVARQLADLKREFSKNTVSYS